MKRTITILAFVIALSFASIANADVFTFDQPIANPADFALEGENVSAQFTNFDAISVQNYLIDLPGGPGTISFDQAVFIKAIDFVQGLPSSVSIWTSIDSDPLTFASLTDYAGPALGIVQIQFDGFYAMASLEASPTPIPGAVWLLGSGLLGLVGLRRKFD
ncbi:hypothetical protein [Pseudodesulfovibrio sp. zrk46]|uniref:hypothetical protein n=1 Tax=Pseudodesulfovibrio sp. zrk46 TaxID=2725288 RepID=UPI001448E466|nr:hypothetical protein [Pseudodesulfovibrio sp. zrk46]QJB55338.1 hypothetical protein HFN16_02500 [Pseudodesulfovibrio sp. zrk46]